jgi:hypothetical protein
MGQTEAELQRARLEISADAEETNQMLQIAERREFSLARIRHGR